MAQSDDEYAAAENARRLRDAVKRGTIAAVKMNPPRCRVSFGGEHQSGWLQWFTHATSERVDWSAPSVGDPVTVVSEGGDTRNGVVMLGLHIDDKAPPSNDPHDHVTAYCDGATMTYNTKNHTLTWQGVPDGVVKILGESEIEIFGRADVTINSENVVNIHGGKLINADADIINVTATDTINAHADLVNVIATSSVSVTAANRISLTAQTISAWAPGGITLAGPTHITETLVVDKLATFRNDISVTGDNGGTGNITTRGSVLAGQEVQDRQGTITEVRTTYNGHTHICPDGGNSTTEPTNGVKMLGMDRNTGKLLSGTDHIRQSIVDILTTPLGTRVMLPEYGSKLFDLVDNPTDPSLAMRIIMESAGAIARWEPRVRIDRINVLAVDIGKITILIIATDIETQQRLEFNNMELIF